MRIGQSHKGSFHINTFNVSGEPCGMCPLILQVVFEGEMDSDPIVDITNVGIGEFKCKYQLFNPQMTVVMMKVFCMGKLVNNGSLGPSQ
jgi:hypothetical protein